MIRVWALGAFLMLASCGTPTSVKCTSANCSGCCAESGECLGANKQSPQACGATGAVCRVCLPQQLCVAGACLRDPDAGFVLEDGGAPVDSDAGQADSGAACGARGQACCANATCYLSLSCQRGVCDLPAAADAGPCGGLGEPCCANQQCAASNTSCNGTTCVVTVQDAGPLKGTGEACALDRECIDGACLVLGFTGGYCTKACATSATCVAGSQCGVNPSGVGPTNICLKQCSSPGQAPGGCRTSYVCEANAGTSGVPVCFPGCSSVTMCGVAPTCDSRGFCCGVPGFVCCEGSTCQSGNTCTNGSCTGGSTGGGGGGTATGGGGGTATGGGGGTATGGGGGTATGGGGGTATGGGTGGGAGPVGSACTSFIYDCIGDTCFQQQGTQWTGGYCSQSNCTASSCPSGSSCSPYLGTSTPYCLKNCTWDGGAGGCRTGYVCDRYLIAGPPNPNPAATCTTACTTGTECGTGRCSNGFCCGNPYYRCCAGNTCPGGGTCTNGYCL